MKPGWPLTRLYELVETHRGGDAGSEEVAVWIEADCGPWVQALLAKARMQPGKRRLGR